MGYTLKIVILLLLPLSGFSQIDNLINEYQKPDCSDTILKAFFNNPNRIVLYPNDRVISKTMNHSNVKFENQLTEEDYKKPIEIYFPIREYQNWEKLDIPISKTKNGFKYKNLQFDSEDDAFMILTPTRYVISGNSQEIIDEVSNYTIPEYPITIIQNGNFAIFAGDNFEIALKEIEQENYSLKLSSFFEAKVSNTIINSDSTLKVLDSFVAEFCDSACLDFPEQRIKCFVHTNPNVARLFSNHGWSDCNEYDSAYIFGTVKFGIVHTVGLDFSFISHETIHSIWNTHYGNSNFLLNEGVAVYYSLFQNYSKDYIENLDKIREQFYNTVKSNMEYDFLKLVTNKDDFWINPGLSYPFAGLFSKYLINNYGLNAFKIIYSNYKNADSFKTVYKKTLSQLIKEFKESIVSINAP